eukprot:Selendium_serpulae@DN7372_c0_g1_i1.p1
MSNDVRCADAVSYEEFSNVNFKRVLQERLTNDNLHDAFEAALQKTVVITCPLSLAGERHLRSLEQFVSLYGPVQSFEPVEWIPNQVRAQFVNKWDADKIFRPPNLKKTRKNGLQKRVRYNGGMLLIRRLDDSINVSLKVERLAVGHLFRPDVEPWRIISQSVGAQKDSEQDKSKNQWLQECDKEFSGKATQDQPTLSLNMRNHSVIMDFPSVPLIDKEGNHVKKFYSLTLEIMGLVEVCRCNLTQGSGFD